MFKNKIITVLKRRTLFLLQLSKLNAAIQINLDAHRLTLNIKKSYCTVSGIYYFLMFKETLTPEILFLEIESQIN